jgi:cytochrome c oxidase cbb3-type subunit I/II
MANGDATLRRVVYDDAIVRAFALATMVWGAVGILLGVVVATQLSFWQTNLGPWLNFGRLRPLHTNAVIFAFVGNMMFCGIYYSTQRLLKVRLASDLLGRIHFWGWQLIIVAAAVTLPLGLTQGKEYAELIWPLDIAIAVVWVIFGVNFFWTVARRNEPNLYVALWFYIATIVTIAVLHIVNSLQLPDSFLHSYPIFAGVQDALVQWWYGHNAVAFFLTTPILGIMYYFLPKAAERPVYSYRLSVVHFWSLVFIYIWAGPHHLLYTALPDWAQTLGMIFSIMLWAPSWGGMLNGLLTLRGAWQKLRTDPVIKFFVLAVTFYGMSTFEGPLLAVKSVSALGHYTDWIIGHVHGGALGWNGFMAFGMLYWLVPRLWGRELRWPRLADAHFWLGTFGILLYLVSMWISGVSQGLYWRALDADGFLKYPDFIEGLLASRYMYHTRLLGGIAYLAGFVLMLVNLAATIRAGAPTTVAVDVLPRPRAASVPTWKLLTGAPVILSLVIVGLAIALGAAGIIQGVLFLTLLIFATIVAVLIMGGEGAQRTGWHRRVEGNSLAFTLLVLVAVLAGGLAEIIPTLVMGRRLAHPPIVATAGPTPGSLGAADRTAGAAVDTAAARVAASPWRQIPYSPLEQEGRDLYVREGCYLCHSQMIRPFRHETLRYGEWSRAEESMYDHPFQWGSKRTGPDLARVGVKYGNLWHYLHLMDPRQTSPGSLMPSYAFLKEGRVDLDHTPVRLRTLARLGVPYSEAEIRGAGGGALDQGRVIAADLVRQGVQIAPDSELAALIAYLQRLGRPPQAAAAATDAPAGGR